MVDCRVQARRRSTAYLAGCSSGRNGNRRRNHRRRAARRRNPLGCDEEVSFQRDDSDRLRFCSLCPSDSDHLVFHAPSDHAGTSADRRLGHSRTVPDQSSLRHGKAFICRSHPFYRDSCRRGHRCDVLLYGLL